MTETSSSSLTAPVGRDELDAVVALYLGFIVSKCMAVVAQFGVADALGPTPATAAELAEKLGLNADALARILRLVAALGIFEDLGGRFRHTPSSRLLRGDHPQSLRDTVSLTNAEFRIWDALEHSLRTGRPAIETLATGGVWEWLRANPDVAAAFDRRMISRARLYVAGILKAYDFSRFRSIADIGGGRGHLLQAVLEAVPGAKGTLFDQPSVVDAVRANPPARTRIVGGDFFKDPLPRSDAYLLMQVIHDWNDEPAVSILRSVRTAAPPYAKLLLIEMLLPEKAERGLGIFVDLQMLVWTGGRERKRSEYERLLHAAGWRLERIVPTESGIAILESTPMQLVTFDGTPGA